MSPLNPRLLRPTASGFDPRRIAGLSMWMDAADSATLFDETTGGSLVAAGGAVARWEDKSGNARHATQGTANNRPLRQSAAQNSRDGVEFDGVNDSLATAAFAHSVPFTIFVVHRFTSATQMAFARVVEHGANNGLAIINNTNVNGLIPLNQYAVQYASTAFTNTGINFTTTTRVLEYFGTDETTRNLSFLVNGGSLATATRSTTPTTPTAFSFSKIGSASVAELGAQILFEICYYNRTLSASERQSVRQYLTRKWNVT